MLIAELALYQLSRLLSRSQVALTNEMKESLQDEDAEAAYRSQELTRILAALRRYDIRIGGANLLDLGCNEGAITVQYAGRGPQSVLGLDVDADAIAKAKRQRMTSGVEFRLSGTAVLPVDSESIDVIISYDVFEHVADPPTLLAECRRVLRPGGKMLIGSWGWCYPYAHHLWSAMPVPWAHVLVSERTLLRASRRVYHSQWYRPMRHDFNAAGQRKKDRYTEDSISADYLNKFLVKDFERAFERSGMRWRLELEPFGAAPWSKPLLAVPIVREFVHRYFWAVLEKPRVN